METNRNSSLNFHNVDISQSQFSTNRSESTSGRLSQPELNQNADTENNISPTVVQLQPLVPPGQNEVMFGRQKCIFYFGLYILYQVIVFFSLLGIGVGVYKFFSLVARAKHNDLRKLGDIGSFNSVLYVCLLLKLLQDYFEYKYVDVHLTRYFRDFPNFKHIYSWVMVTFTGICYYIIFTQVYRKCRVLAGGGEKSLADTIDPSSYIIALSYIHYTNVVNCIKGSETTKMLDQIIQNVLNLQFSTQLLRFGGFCGYLMFERKVSVLIVTPMLVSITILSTLAYLLTLKYAFSGIDRGSGGRWPEVVWSTLITNVLLICYFEMRTRFEVVPCGFRFMCGVPYLLFLTTKLFAPDILGIKV